MMLLMSALSSLAGSVRLYESPARGKRSIEVGDMFYIYVEVSDINGRPEIPSNIGGAKVMYFDHTGQSSRMSNVNGQVTQSTSNTWTVTLRAQKEGTYSFGPITVGGVKSNQLRYTIGARGTGTNNPAGGKNPDNSASSGNTSDKPKFIGKGDGNLFMRASVSESNVYEQQALVYLSLIHI